MHLVKPLLAVALAIPLVMAGPRGHGLRRRTGDDDKDSSSSSLPAKDLTISSSSPAKDQPSLTSVGKDILGTGISSASGAIQEVVLTDVVYTTLTTCPVTSLVTSGSISFEETTTTISTVTRTSTSTLCTKCVAPPSKPAGSSSSPGKTIVTSLPSFTIYPLSQPSILISSAAEVIGTGTASSPSKIPVFPSLVSLTVSATSGASSLLQFPGYGIVPSPTSAPGSPREELFSNPESSIIPVYTAALLGNAYGGGFVSTPSVYVTKLPYPNGPSSGVPPGYESGPSNNVTTVVPGLEASTISTTTSGKVVAALAAGPSFGVSPGSESESSITIIGNNFTEVVTGLAAGPSSGVSLGSESEPSVTIIGNNFREVVTGLAASPQITTEFGVPAFTATIASNSSPGASTNSGTNSAKEGSTPTFISLSPFGGEVGQESGSAAIPTVVSVQTAVIGPSTTSITGSSGEVAEFGSLTGTSTGSVAIPPTVTTISPLSGESSPSQVITTAAAILAGATPSPTFSSRGVNVEAGATIIPSLPSEQAAVPVVTLAIGPSAEQIAGQPAASTPSTSTPSPVILANSEGTTLAVVPSPVVGANGLTSLAVFSTPLASASPGLTPPAVLLTPVVGPNGLTSLAVVATPVVGANGLTSLAIGFETETAPAAGQSNGAPTPIEGFVVVQSPAVIQHVPGIIPTQAPQVSGFIPNQGLQVSGVVPNQTLQVSGIIPTGANIAASGFSKFPVSGGSGSGNYSIHVLLNPTTAAQFRGSAVGLTVGFGVGLFGLGVFLVLL